MYIFDDATLPHDGAFWSAKIEGLSPTTELLGYTWIVGIKCRSKSCPEFISWFVRKVVLPFVDLCRATCHVPDTPLFYSFDGEAKIMNPMLTSDLIPLWSARGVIMVKHAGSTSALCNACDTGDMHKATKASVKCATEDSALNSKKGAQAKILAAFLLHSPTVPLVRRTLVCNHILRIIASYQRVVTSTMIKKSFMKSGQLIPPGSAHQDFLDSKLALCSTKLTATQGEAIRAGFPALVALAKLKGKLTEAEMDAAGIPKHQPGKVLIDKRAKPKDQRPLHNQRTAVVNLEPVLAQFNAYQAAILAKKTAPKSTSKRRRKTNPKQVVQSAQIDIPAEPISEPAVLRLTSKSVPLDTAGLPELPEGFNFLHCELATFECPVCGVSQDAPATFK